MIGAKTIIDRRIERAQNFKDIEPEFFFGLGRTTPWENEYEPPSVTGVETEVEELFGFAQTKVTLPDGTEDSCGFVVEDSEGDILYNDRYYRLLNNGDEVEENATSLYFESIIPVSVFEGHSEFRQMGLYYGLQRESVVDNAEMLDYPDEVVDVGTIYAISNFTKIERRDDRLARLQLIVYF